MNIINHKNPIRVQLHSTTDCKNCIKTMFIQ